MKLLRKIRQHRRDFTAIYQCEHCGHEEQGDGYDDAYFHQQVIPRMTCSGCGRDAADDTPKSMPDVPAGLVL